MGTVLVLLAAMQAVHYVDAAGGCDGRAPCHADVAAALAAAADGDTIVVFPGRYDAPVRIVGRTGVAVVGHAPGAELAAELFLDDIAGVRIENLDLLAGATAVRARDGRPANAFVGNRVTGRVFLQTCFGWRIAGNAFGGPLEIAGDARCTIAGNTFADGLRLSGQDNSTDTSIVDNVVVAGSIVVSSERVRGLTITGNRLYAGEVVIDAREAHDNVVERNRPP